MRTFPSLRVPGELTFGTHQVLEPSTTLWRREIKLIVARKGGDGEIVEGTFLSILQSRSANWCASRSSFHERCVHDALVRDRRLAVSSHLLLDLSPADVSACSLVGEIHRLPDDRSVWLPSLRLLALTAPNRRLLRFTVIDALLDVGLARLGASSSEPTSTSTETSDIGTGPQAFITQILTTAVFLVTDKDKQRLVDLFDKITLSASFYFSFEPGRRC